MNKNETDRPKYSYEELSEKYINKSQEKKVPKNDNNKGFGKAYAAITSFIFTLIITMFIAIFLGTYLDQWLNTKFLFTGVFLLLGILASFRNLIVYTK